MASIAVSSLLNIVRHHKESGDQKTRREAEILERFVLAGQAAIEQQEGPSAPEDAGAPPHAAHKRAAAVNGSRHAK